MSSLESIIENNEVDFELSLEALRFSNAIKAINQIKPKGNQMYIYKPEITYRRFTVNEIKNISDPKEIVEIFRSLLMGPIEKVAVIFLNCRNDIVERILYSEMTSGTVDQSAVYPREIIKMAILNNSTRIIMCHNHPSGHASPSSNDKQITKLMKDASKLLNLEFLDHIIITEDSYYSFQEMGEI